MSKKVTITEQYLSSLDSAENWSEITLEEAEKMKADRPAKSSMNMRMK